MRSVLAVGNGDLWLMSTPNGKRGFFHAEWKEGGELWRRISATAEECPWIDAGFLADERKNMTDAFFRQEYMCEFREAEGREAWPQINADERRLEKRKKRAQMSSCLLSDHRPSKPSIPFVTLCTLSTTWGICLRSNCTCLKRQHKGF
jgi:hypothetical protein